MLHYSPLLIDLYAVKINSNHLQQNWVYHINLCTTMEQTPVIEKGEALQIHGDSLKLHPLRNFTYVVIRRYQTFSNCTKQDGIRVKFLKSL